MEVNWPSGPSITKFKQVISRKIKDLTEGTVIAIDPGSKSTGYALFEKGIMVESGLIKSASQLPINTRLYEIVKGSPKVPADVLIIEDIGKGKMAHVYLKYTVGAILSAYPHSEVIFCPISVWKSYAKAHGITDKNDELDAQCIGKSIIQWAKEMKNAV